LARSITVRRSSAVSSWPTFSDQLGALAIAPQGDLDGPLHRLGDVDSIGRDPSLRRARHEVDVAVADVGDHRPGRELDRLADQRERVIVVLWAITNARSGSSRAIRSRGLADGHRVRS
jgi:hypothetical protein